MPDLISVVEWSRWQFALTAMYHWLFVPLTLGLSLIVAIMESLGVARKSEKMLSAARFWTKIFAINFVCGVATGIILEFEFGTNWSNYSWFVGDIFGAPLAIEGLFAFFLESTFVVVMVLGWGRVSKRFHLTSTWLTTIGAMISALWILVANAWMQFPTGMTFNPDTMRNEMTDFWAVALSPVALNKLLHAVTSSWCLGGAFVIGVSCYMLRRRRGKVAFAIPSIKVAGWVGLIGICLTFLSGHSTAVYVSETQPMKLAAMEGLWCGGKHTELVAVGLLNPEKTYGNDAKPYLFKIGIPGGLSWLAKGSTDAYIPGIYDLTAEYPARMAQGAIAREALAEYGATRSAEALNTLNENYADFGYGYYDSPSDFVPPVAMTFYAFHIMVTLGGYLMLFFIVALVLAYKKESWLSTLAASWIGMLTICAAWVCSQAGWVCAEVGRQPWVIQDLMPTRAAISALEASSVQLTFWLFAAVFTLLLIAEASIMLRKIHKV
ncbi:MAG: cytochrome ubiquinol oxidase subunit I [Bacteroides sp.]|nr:cytochrome ubiquinol oxidase subunit I [Bacteroides sp.]MCM1380178.1 cytochrome ubiquinol oxidase subunit I [Bacteroides sp.]MCM1446507.1 cytochrome ubiquinol oxidase subunit I [Prevotella sp.]